MRDRDIEEAIRAAKAASEAVDRLREKVWTLIQKDPSYNLIVLNGLRSAGQNFFRASLMVDIGTDMLSDLEVIDRAGVA